MRILKTLFASFLVLLLAGCGYNDIQRADEAVKSSWSEVLNQYQRRADLVTNLVTFLVTFSVTLPNPSPVLVFWTSYHASDLLTCQSE